jgi:DNA-binding XRE family transcriptional regulator
MEEHLVKKYQPPKEIKSEHQELMIKIGLKLEELRKDKKISSSGLAKEIGISRNAYHQMEIGNVYFNLLSLLQVLNYHQVSLPDFFNTLK